MTDTPEQAAERKRFGEDIEAMRAMQAEYDSLLERWREARAGSQEIANLHATFKARERALGVLVEGGLLRRVLAALSAAQPEPRVSLEMVQAMERWTDKLADVQARGVERDKRLAAAPPAQPVGEPVAAVGMLTISLFKGHLENVDFDYYGELAPGSYPLYASPAALADERDAKRLDYIEEHARCDPKMDGQHVWWPTTFNHRLVGLTLRAAIDAALQSNGG